MSVEIKVPVLPESVSDATVATWHKKPGDAVARDENLVDLETDKVVLEVPAPKDGVLKDISKEAGETVTAEEVLGVMEEGEAPAADKGDSTEGTQADKSDSEDSSGDDSGKQKADKAETGKDGQVDVSGQSPSVQRIAREEQVDPNQVEGSGRGGRVTKADMLDFLKSGGAAGSRTEERVKMSRLRQRVAERLKDAQNTAAMLTSFNEVDMKAVMDLRKKYKETFIEQHGIKLGIMSFFVKACVEALRKQPIVNASVDGEDIIYHGFQDIGIAVSTDRGLMVPVLKNAEQMSLAQIEMQISEYASQARKGTISLDALQGGTFTITNGGVFGSLISTPIVNPPQSAILGMHTIKERPVVVDGDIVARPMMYIALSYDHRIIDGKDAVMFLVNIKEALEDPARMLLGL